MTEIACGRCGTIADASAAYCGFCGARLRPTESTGAIVAAPSPQTATTGGAASAVPSGWELPWQRSEGRRAIAWLLVVGVVLLAIIAAAVVGWLIAHRPPECEGGGCKDPIFPAPLANADPYSSETFGYSLDAAPTACSYSIRVVERPNDGISWLIKVNRPTTFEWPTRVRGEPVNGRSAEAIVEQVGSAEFGGATLVYAIPQAAIGWTFGAGAVYDGYVGAGSSSPVHARFIVLAAVKGDLAIVATSQGPWSDAQKGHPNPSHTGIATCIDSILTTVAWPGEPPP